MLLLISRRSGLIFSLLLSSGFAGMVLFAWPFVNAQTSAIDGVLAQQYFSEAKAASVRDNGSLWKVQLCGPLLFVDPDTRAIAANQGDTGGQLKASDGLFTGLLPADVGIANTATKWGGVHWTMVMWPLPQYRRDRVRLLMHECFHRVQGEIGLSAADTMNSHLDSRDGRIWLQLEWRALERALWQQGQDRGRAVEDALYFRAYRRSLFPEASARENALELNEGLAEYTGLKLSTLSLSEFNMVAASGLRSAAISKPNFVRSFAYMSGPAYGGLLDATDLQWRPSLTARSDLGQLLAAAYKIKLPDLAQAEALRRAQRYDGDEVVALETRWDEQHRTQLAEVRRRFIDGSLLVFPLSADVNYTFNPNAVVAIDDSSTVYEGNVQVTDQWGMLKSTKGVLMTRANGRLVRAQVAAPSDPSIHPFSGDGWSLDLKPEWNLAAGTRAADLIVTERPKN